MNLEIFFATVHSLVEDISLIDSCQAHLPVQYASNIEFIWVARVKQASCLHWLFRFSVLHSNKTVNTITY